MLMEPTAARKPRTRRAVSRWFRVLWLGALLIGLLYAHGLHADGIAEHAAPGSIAAAAAPGHPEHVPASGDGHDTDGESAHAVRDCATGQPTEAVDVPPPALSSLSGEPLLSRLAHSDSRAAVERPVTTGGSSAVVLRI
ncbi:hypothetical protein ACFY8W_23625 [Streptomyces sp. NPDC012637]|uniref:hypothetical protein n=1 Tax=Streptomyces sp. NPDC012637 TaxID=3364842 RepID=UPI0036E28A88